jgi:hypothetical protein
MFVESSPAALCWPTIINMQEKNSSIKTSAFSKRLRIIYLEGEKGVVSEANMVVRAWWFGECMMVVFSLFTIYDYIAIKRKVWLKIA